MSIALKQLEATHKKEVKRGQVWIANLDGIGSEQRGVRPVVVLQNEIGNRYAPTVTIAPLSSSQTKKPLPTHVKLEAKKTGLVNDSTIFVEQLRTISKERLLNLITTIEDVEILEDVASAIRIQLSV